LTNVATFQTCRFLFLQSQRHTHPPLQTRNGCSGSETSCTRWHYFDDVATAE